MFNPEEGFPFWDFQSQFTGGLMKIAVVGGGTRCRDLIRVIDTSEFHEFRPEIIAVADIDPTRPGYVAAKEKGLFVTRDYNDFFNIDDIELIIELTGDIDIYNDILKKKGREVRAISAKTARLFWEISYAYMKGQKVEDELQKTRNIYELLMNTLIQEDVIIIGLDYRITDINQKALQQLGFERDEVIGRYCYEVTHRRNSPCSGEEHPCPLLETIKKRKPSQSTHVHLDKDGNEIYYSISCYPMIENDELVGAIEVSRDISKEIWMQRNMMNQEKLAAIGRLSAGVAHEINNPLTTILTSAMLVQEDLEKDDPIYEELETISKETLRCRKIVTSLLDFARQSTPRKKSCDPNILIKDSILLTRKQAAFKDVEIEKYSVTEVPEMQLDKGQIQQALINLIINAVEASEPGGKIKVSSKFSPINCMLEISVTDRGKGIEKDKMRQIFEPFFTEKDTGTGLGLAITHGIIERHDGGHRRAEFPGKGNDLHHPAAFPPGR